MEYNRSQRTVALYRIVNTACAQSIVMAGGKSNTPPNHANICSVSQYSPAFAIQINWVISFSLAWERCRMWTEMYTWKKWKRTHRRMMGLVHEWKPNQIYTFRMFGWAALVAFMRCGFDSGVRRSTDSHINFQWKGTCPRIFTPSCELVWCLGQRHHLETKYHQHVPNRECALTEALPW